MNLTQAKQALFSYGLRAGVGYPVLRRCANGLGAVTQLGSWWQRRQDARRIFGVDGRLIPPDAGCVLVDSSTISTIPSLVTASQTVFKAHEQTLTRTPGQPFDNILTVDDLATHPEFFAAAFNRELVAAVTQYLGALPRLHNISIFVTQANERLAQSQLYHLDKPEANYMALFVNVFNVAPENGPLTLLPANISSSACERLRYYHRSYLGTGRCTDEEIFSICAPENAIAVLGPPGRGVLLDTSRCLHFGSRCRSGKRVMAVIHYALPHRIPNTFGDRMAMCPPELRRIFPWLIDSAAPATAL